MKKVSIAQLRELVEQYQRGRITLVDMRLLVGIRRKATTDDPMQIMAELLFRADTGLISPEWVQILIEDPQCFRAMFDPVSMLPIEMKIGDRTYEVLDFLRKGEDYVEGHIMVERAVEMDANQGEDDGQYLLDHQQDIPAVLRGKIKFVFTDWRHSSNSRYVYYIFWQDEERRWVRHRFWLNGGWGGNTRVLRRKK